jgi:hypothetical protein
MPSVVLYIPLAVLYVLMAVLYVPLAVFYIPLAAFYIPRAVLYIRLAVLNIPLAVLYEPWQYCTYPWQYFCERHCAYLYVYTNTSFLLSLLLPFSLEQFLRLIKEFYCIFSLAKTTKEVTAPLGR